MAWRPISEYRQELKRRNKSDVERFDAWARERGVTHYGFGDAYNFADTMVFGRSKPKDWAMDFPPFSDHPRFFKNSRTQKVWYVAQPYDRPEEITPVLKQWALEHFFNVEVFPPEQSWHYPGRTCLVVFDYPTA